MHAELQAVLFDLDDTLLDRRGSFEQFVRDQWKRFLPSVQAIDQEQYVQTLVELDRNGYAPRKGLFGGLTARFGLSADVADSLLTDYRTGFPRACRLFPDAMQTLSALRAAGLKLGLITNGSFRMQSRKLQCLALSSAFDTVLISDAEGVSKPDVCIFLRALERLDVEPAAAAFVGDNPEVDVTGARAAGMRAIWRRDPSRSGTVEADAVIDQLEDLVGLLRRVGVRQ
jgi:putative hydrolase of the HAD superfamily